ncbi:MAG TPA: hypothetical protein VNO30_25245 [Kofleriaceae bacterium]|nr:hypothetical protein [Kofleriaceae bacterium]
MATDDDDILTGLVPDPDAEPTAAERAHAKTFAELVDKTLSGRTPPAMSADDRALLEVATVIRATSGGLPLAPAKQRDLIEDVLRQAVGVGGGAGTGTSSGAMPGVVPIERARARRWAPWIVAGASTLVAAAAVVTLWLRTPSRPSAPAPPVARAVPASWTSRPTDPLIGPIPRERAGDAGARIDYIFADRLDGFRERRWSPGEPGSRGGKR